MIGKYSCSYLNNSKKTYKRACIRIEGYRNQKNEYYVLIVISQLLQLINNILYILKVIILFSIIIDFNQRYEKIMKRLF